MSLFSSVVYLSRENRIEQWFYLLFLSHKMTTIKLITIILPSADVEQKGWQVDENCLFFPTHIINFGQVNCGSSKACPALKAINPVKQTLETFNNHCFKPIRTLFEQSDKNFSKQIRFARSLQGNLIKMLISIKQIVNNTWKNHWAVSIITVCWLITALLRQMNTRKHITWNLPLCIKARIKDVLSQCRRKQSTSES